MSKQENDKDFVFAKLALQNGFLKLADVETCLRAIAKDKNLSLRTLLIDQAGLTREDLQKIEQLALSSQTSSSRTKVSALTDVPTLGSGQELEKLEESDISLILDSFVGSINECTAAENSGSILASDDEKSAFHVGSNPPESSNRSTTSGGSTKVQTSRFRIGELHASGGLGEVYFATDTELERQVALKQIRPRFADEDLARLRFETEACITGGLEHPGIVPVYGFGKYPDGRPYYAMRFIHGDTLKESVARWHDPKQNGQSPSGHRGAPMSFDGVEFRNLLLRFVDACQAIGYAHSREIIHRDIKPSNIMLGPFGETLVVDWGLAKHLDTHGPVADFDASTIMLSKSGSQASATVHGSTIGTPPFMSPEQARGDLEEMGPQSDIYSLGATLYMMLTGVPPYQGKDSRAIVEAVKAGDLIHPHQKNRLIPKPLGAICVKAMAKSPSDRYESAIELAAELERWMADQPVDAFQDRWSTRARRWFRKHKAAAVSTIIVAATVTVASVLAAVFLNIEQQKTSDALNKLEVQQSLTLAALDNESLARKQTQRLLDSVSSDLLTDLLSQSEVLRSTDEAFLNKMLQHFQDFDAGDRDGLSNLVRGNGLIRIANIQRRLGLSDEAAVSSEQAVSICESALSANDFGESATAQNSGTKEILAQAFSTQGLLFGERNELENADNAFQSAQKIWFELSDRFQENTNYQYELANVLVNKANIKRRRGETTRSRSAYYRAIDLYESIDKHDQSSHQLITQSQAVANLAGLLANKPDEIPEAIRLYKKSRDSFSALIELDPRPDYRSYLVNSKVNLGNCLLKLDRKKAAIAELQSAVKDQRALVDEFPLRKPYLAELGRAYRGLGTAMKKTNPDFAEKMLLDAKIVFQKLATDSDPQFLGDLANATESLGLFYTERSNPLGVSLSKEAIELREQRFADDEPNQQLHMDLLRSEINLANSLRVSKKYEPAIQMYENVLERLDTLDSVPRQTTRQVLFGLGFSRVESEQYRSALDCWERLCEDPDDPKWNAFAQQRAIGLVRIGKVAEGVNASESLLLDADVTPEMYYDAGCCCAIAAGELESNEKVAAAGRNSEWFRKRALAHLESAADAGFFEKASMRVHASTDHDLDSLRAWKEFQVFAQENNIPVQEQTEKVEDTRD